MKIYYQCGEFTADTPKELRKQLIVAGYQKDSHFKAYRVMKEEIEI